MSGIVDLGIALVLAGHEQFILLADSNQAVVDLDPCAVILGADLALAVQELHHLERKVPAFRLRMGAALHPPGHLSNAGVAQADGGIATVEELVDGR